MLDGKKILTEILQSCNSGSTETTSNDPTKASGANFSIVDFLGGLFGGKEKGNILEGLIKGGGLEAVAGVAFNALKNFEKHDQSANQKIDLTEMGQTGADHNSDFALTLVCAMIQAAKADGHVDDKERQLIVDKINASGVGQKTAEFLMEELEKPVDIDALVNSVNTDEQKTELYVASRMILDLTKPKNREYLDELMEKLALPVELKQHIEQAINDANR